MYKLSLLALASTIAVTSAAKEYNGYTYAGCQSRNAFLASGFELTEHTEPTPMTIETCTAACDAAGTDFAIFDVVNCSCGNEYDLESVDDSLCATACPGDASEICGGYGGSSPRDLNYYVSVYEYGFVEEDPVEQPSTPSSTATTSTAVSTPSTAPSDPAAGADPVSGSTSTSVAAGASATTTASSSSIIAAAPTAMNNSDATTTSASSTMYSTSTLYQTKVFTITSCAPAITDCPARVVTSTISVGITICPVGEVTTTSASPMYTTPVGKNTTLTSSMTSATKPVVVANSTSVSTGSVKATPSPTATPSSNTFKNAAASFGAQGLGLVGGVLALLALL